MFDRQFLPQVAIRGMGQINASAGGSFGAGPGSGGFGAGTSAFGPGDSFGAGGAPVYAPAPVAYSMGRTFKAGSRPRYASWTVNSY